MPRFVIDRDIDGIGASTAQELCEAAGASNGVIADMRAENKFIQWEHTYIAANKTFCIYLSENEDLIKEHAERSGFPATIITEIKTKIDPTTAES